MRLLPLLLLFLLLVLQQQQQQPQENSSVIQSHRACNFLLSWLFQFQFLAASGRQAAIYPSIYLSPDSLRNSTQSLHMFAFQFDWKIYFIRFSLCVRTGICTARPPGTTRQRANHPTTQPPKITQHRTTQSTVSQARPVELLACSSLNV